MKIYLAGQQTLANRGCEALVVSTMQMLSNVSPNVRFVIPSTDIHRDGEAIARYDFDNYTFTKAPRITISIRLWNRLMRYVPWLARVWMPKAMAWPRETLEELKGCDRALHIGGDTFSYDYSYAGLISNTAQIDHIAKLGIPQEIWCATVGPFSECKSLEREVLKKLRKLERITVREKASQDYLETNGLRAQIVSDPAFNLTPSEGFAEGLDGSKPRIALNISPYIYRGNTKAIVDKCIKSFVAKRLAEGFDIALISHVNTATSSDSSVIQDVLGEFLQQENVHVIPTNLSAAEYKGIVSKSDYVVASRTHVTIAGFSTATPVLSIAYSAKAPRLNAFLFGHELFTVKSSELSERNLEDTFQRIVDNKEEISETLTNKSAELRVAFQKLCESVTVE
jgi:colanic acid/amylovoran biosynthesis protein